MHVVNISDAVHIKIYVLFILTLLLHWIPAVLYVLYSFMDVVNWNL